jgi:hypothetical protein
MLSICFREKIFINKKNNKFKIIKSRMEKISIYKYLLSANRIAVASYNSSSSSYLELLAVFGSSK